eukprot:gene31833-7039_t
MLPDDWECLGQEDRQEDAVPPPTCLPYFAWGIVCQYLDTARDLHSLTSTCRSDWSAQAMWLLQHKQEDTLFHTLTLADPELRLQLMQKLLDLGPTANAMGPGVPGLASCIGRSRGENIQRLMMLGVPNVSLTYFEGKMCKQEDTLFHTLTLADPELRLQLMQKLLDLGATANAMGPGVPGLASCIGRSRGENIQRLMMLGVPIVSLTYFEGKMCKQEDTLFHTLTLADPELRLQLMQKLLDLGATANAMGPGVPGLASCIGRSRGENIQRLMMLGVPIVSLTYFEGKMCKQEDTLFHTLTLADPELRLQLMQKLLDLGATANAVGPGVPGLASCIE